jgi:hypothetical protein
MIGKAVWEITRRNKILISALFSLSFLQFFFVTYNIESSLPLVKLLNSPIHSSNFIISENGLFGIVKMPNYRKTAQAIIDIIGSSRAYDTVERGVHILTLVEDEEQELYFTMEELSVSKAGIASLERPFADDFKDFVQPGRKPNLEVLNSNYVVFRRGSHFNWKHTQDYYHNFLINKDKFALIGTVLHSPGIQFDIFMRNA